jgi:hypothetical protein
MGLLQECVGDNNLTPWYSRVVDFMATVVCDTNVICDTNVDDIMDVDCDKNIENQQSTVLDEHRLYIITTWHS